MVVSTGVDCIDEAEGPTCSYCNLGRDDNSVVPLMGKDSGPGMSLLKEQSSLEKLGYEMEKAGTAFHNEMHNGNGVDEKIHPGYNDMIMLH